MLRICEQLGRRAREASRRGETTFAVPEAGPAAAWVASTAPDPALRAKASAWLSEGASYHALLRLCVEAVLALDGGEPFEASYRERVQGELAPMLALWPGSLVLPTAEP